MMRMSFEVIFIKSFFSKKKKQWKKSPHSNNIVCHIHYNWIYIFGFSRSNDIIQPLIYDRLCFAGKQTLLFIIYIFHSCAQAKL